MNVDNLVEKGLVKKKTYTEGKYKGLSVLKYSKRVFWDNLWNEDERLLNCRGTVIDEDNNIIVQPFLKVFNLGENGTDIDPEREVTCPRKVNGFMCAVTLTENYGLIVSTTGSLDSPFVELAKKWVDTLNLVNMIEGITLLFEVCDSSDPHIVPEEEGIYLLAVIDKELKMSLPEDMLDLGAEELNCKRPEVWKGKFKDLPLDVKHEGYMVRCTKTGETLCKIKSPHYLSKKMLQRVGKNKASKMWSNPKEFKQSLDEEFYDCFDWIVSNYTQDQYLMLSEQERRNIIENYYAK